MIITYKMESISPRDCLFKFLIGFTLASGVATIVTGDIIYLGATSFLSLTFSYIFWNELNDEY